MTFWPWPFCLVLGGLRQLQGDHGLSLPWNPLRWVSQTQDGQECQDSRCRLWSWKCALYRKLSIKCLDCLINIKFSLSYIICSWRIMATPTSMALTPLRVFWMPLRRRICTRTPSVATSLPMINAQFLTVSIDWKCYCYCYCTIVVYIV